MILYHGTNAEFTTIDLSKTKPYKDFGRGFEWADFIFKNRSRSQQFQNPFDIVQGPIADDGVAYLLNLYEDGLRTLDELAKELEYKNLNNQFCFLTEKALGYLRRQG